MKKQYPSPFLFLLSFVSNREKVILKCFLLYVLLIINTPIFSQLTYDWGITMGNNGRDEITDLALDPMGNVYVTGVFEDSIAVETSSGTSFIKGGGWRDGLIAKYGPDGMNMWAIGFGNTAWDRGWSITTDTQGAVYAGGVFSGKVDFDPSADSTFLISNQKGVWPDGYLAKYDTDGNLLWANHLLTARDLGASQTATLLGIQSMHIDSNGDLIIGGMFWDTVWLSPSVMLVSDGPLRDMFLAKYDSNGNLIWGQQMGGAADQEIRSVAVDPSGNIFASGYFFGTADFDPSATEMLLTSEGAGDIFLAKYSPSGTLAWVHGFGSADASIVRPEVGDDVGLDQSGNVYITGTLYGTIDFDPSTASDSLQPSSPSDLFTAKYDPEGNLIWVFSLDGSAFQYGKRISVQDDGSFFLAGEYGSILDLDPSADSSFVYPLGGEDIFMAKYTTDAQFIEGKGIRGLNSDQLAAMQGQGDEIVIGGLFYQTILLDQQSGDLRFSKGDADLFFAKYGGETTANQDHDFEGRISIFPNPAQDHLSMEADWSTHQAARIRIRNLHGQVMLERQLAAATAVQTEVSTAKWPRGLYLFELILPSSTYQQKIILN